MTLQQLKARASELGLVIVEGDKRLKSTWESAVLWAESMVGMMAETVEQVAQETLETAQKVLESTQETLEGAYDSAKTFWYSEGTQDALRRLRNVFVFLCTLCVLSVLVARDLYKATKGLQEYLSETFMKAKDDLRELREFSKTLMPPQTP